MKLNWSFLGGGGGDAKQKTFRGGSMDIFWNNTIFLTLDTETVCNFLCILFISVTFQGFSLY